MHVSIHSAGWILMFVKVSKRDEFSKEQTSNKIEIMEKLFRCVLSFDFLYSAVTSPNDFEHLRRYNFKSLQK